MVFRRAESVFGPHQSTHRIRRIAHPLKLSKGFSYWCQDTRVQRRLPALLGGIIVVVVALPVQARTTSSSPPAAVATDAVPAILELFKTYPVVGLGEGPHGNLEGHAFRLKLIRDPRFPTVVNDILVESGTARYQAVMDRYIRGEGVARQELRRVWEDTTNAGTTWDKPIYEEFFKAVRDVNARLPKGKQLRVLLGDPPIAWEFIRKRGDLRPWGMQRDLHAGLVIKREVLAKNRRALAIYGDGHFQGRGFKDNSLVNVVERIPGTRMFTIATRAGDLIKMQPSIASWTVPSLARIRGTILGEKFYAQFYPMPPANGWNTVRMQDQFDAVLYLGPTPWTMTLVPKALCEDAAYMKMRLARLALIAGAPGATDPVGGLKKLCAEITK